MQTTGPQANEGPILRGARYRQIHRASVMALLGRQAPPVRSRGSRFYNVDRWTARFLVLEMCKWAKENPGCIPTMDIITEWCRAANASQVAFREIVIAATPDHLPIRTAMALTGGAYHECLHTLFSCRRNLKPSEVAKIILPRWAKVADWSRFYGLIQEWSNVIEDIRIERRGREDYPGIEIKMHDLQDFVLKQEQAGRDQVRAHGGKTNGALGVITCTFRDFGLGYVTDIQKVALEGYKQTNPEAVDLVLKGDLAPMLRESIGLSRNDDLGSLRVALDVVTKLAELGGHDQDQQGEDEGKDGQPGDGKQSCPSCGAPAKKIKVRPIADGSGGKVPGKGMATCTACGWQQEVEIKAQKKQPSQAGQDDQDAEEGPQFEGFDLEDFGLGGDEDKDDKDTKPGKGKGDDQDAGDDSDDEDATGTGGGEVDDEADDSDDSGDPSGTGDKAGDDSDEAEGSGASGEADEEGDEGAAGADEGDDAGAEGNADNSSTQGKSGDNASNEDSDSDQPANGAGGHHHDTTQHPGADYSSVAEEAMNQAAKGEDAGLLDNNSALEQAVDAAVGDEDKEVRLDEKPWRPYDPTLDEIEVVGESSEGRDHDNQQAQLLLDSVKNEASFLRARLRNIVRSLEINRVYHGVPKGRLSERRLVTSYIAVRAGEQPRRPAKSKSVKVDTSMAAVALIDESTSMRGKLREATRMLCALVEPLDRLGFATMACGFRDGQSGTHRGWGTPHLPEEGGREYHRYNGITHDVFKAWHESFPAVRYRFANTRAIGGTPMSDGVQFALDNLSPRQEAHRFLFVITDGEPNPGHEAVLRRQFRLAKESGIHVIGVGVGSGASSVKTLFPDHVYSTVISEIPTLLIAKLNELVDIHAAKRGRRMASTG